LEDDLRKRSALGRVSASPAQGGHRQLWSHTIDYEDHLERQKKAVRKPRRKRGRRKPSSRRRRRRPSAKETDFWVFWSS